MRYAEVLKLADEEVNRLEVRLQGHARLLNSGKIGIGDFQERMASSLKESHLRMAMLGAGGKKGMNPQQYGYVGQQLRRQYEYLYKFGKTLEGATLTEAQILRRAKSYAKSANIAFRQAEFQARGRVGFYAKRLLDPQARHCTECISYQVLTWTLISQIVAPGVNCSCGGRCRCRVVFRKL
ncbi:MAG: hypothetical protein KME29_04660 [Calothrix sp. FI2-JRJ7]|nr:hypothetical protein [Calothrix sp. FI2-JRJ7]